MKGIKMSRDSFSLSSVPFEEDCAQVGEDNYRKKAIVECTAYINQLERLFPEAKDHGIEFNMKWHSHDFGSYAEVELYYDDCDDQYAYVIEANLPSNWDEKSLNELAFGFETLGVS
jgi:hypothetical protein